MKNQNIILVMGMLVLVATLIPFASAYTGGYCGDGTCDPADFEDNPWGTLYCPRDCGMLTDREWCEDTYMLFYVENDEALFDMCEEWGYNRCPTPTCGSTGCPTCRISSISTTELNNWCTSHKTLSVTGSTASGESDIFKNYYWIIFLLIGAVGGYFLGQFLKKCKRCR